MTTSIRPATHSDIPVLSRLIERSVRELQRDDYSPDQIDAALATIYGVDTRLIDDGTYLVVETGGAIAACGGWSRRKTLYGGDVWTQRDDDLLDPAVDAAKIRAFFVHPDWARKGLGSQLLDACESAALAAGFRRFELGATLTGVRLYVRRGYVAVERALVPLPGADAIPVIRMVKVIFAKLEPNVDGSEQAPAIE
jgi:GNAT superfamily N-acetyltransferase